jgi:hypothetical protein
LFATADVLDSSEGLVDGEKQVEVERKTMISATRIKSICIVHSYGRQEPTSFWIILDDTEEKTKRYICFGRLLRIGYTGANCLALHQETITSRAIFYRKIFLHTRITLAWNGNRNVEVWLMISLWLVVAMFVFESRLIDELPISETGPTLAMRVVQLPYLCRFDCPRVPSPVLATSQ